MRAPSKFSVALALLASAAAGDASAAGRHVVLIVIDGLRPDAIAAASAPNLQALAAAGSTLPARAVGLPVTMPGLVTMTTGLAPERHHVTWDDERADFSLELPTIFTAVHAAGGHSALYVGKSKLRVLASPGTADVVHGPTAKNREWDEGAAAALAGHFASEFPAQRFTFALVHLREPDHVGHDYGWMSERYLAAVRDADAAVGVIRKAIAGSDAAGSTTVLVTADHGGEGKRHWAGSEISWQVPWICAAPGARRPAPPGTQALLTDVAPTVLAILGLPALPGAEGHPVPGCAP